ncbi:MAG TPA: hypothetical protein VIG77_01800 [Ktedonobacterales bacterium]
MELKTLVATNVLLVCEAYLTLTRMPGFRALRLLAAPLNVVVSVTVTVTCLPFEVRTNWPALASTLATVPRREGVWLLAVGEGLITGVLVARGVVGVVAAVVVCVAALARGVVVDALFVSPTLNAVICQSREDAMTVATELSPATMSIPTTTARILLRRKRTADPPLVWKEVPLTLTNQRSHDSIPPSKCILRSQYGYCRSVCSPSITCRPGCQADSSN